MPKRRTLVRRIQPSFCAYVFDGGPDRKVCLRGATRIGLSEGSSFFGGAGGRGRGRARATAIGLASWCDAHQPVGGIFVFLAGIGGGGRRRGSATATHNAKGKAHNRVQTLFSLGVGGRGRRPLESADPRGSGVRGNRRGLVQGVLEPKKSYPGHGPLPPTGQTLAPWGPSSGSGTGSGGVFGPRWVQTRKSLISLRKRKDFEGSAWSAGDPKSLPRETWRASGASS